MPHNHRALIVGINNYPGIGPLEGAERDGQRFRDWLYLPEGGNFATKEERDRIKEFYSDPKAKMASDASPLKSDIEKYVQKLREEVALPENQGKEFPLGDRMYLLFSGHGFYNQDRKSAVFMANATPQDSGFAVLAKDLWEFLCLQRWFKEVILVCDACREFLNYGKQVVDPYSANGNGQGVRGIAFQASAAGLVTEEKEIGPNGEKGGVLVDAVLRGLSGFAVKRKSSKKITAKELGDYVINAMVGSFGSDFEPDVTYRVGQFTIVSGIEQKRCNLTLKEIVGNGKVQVELYNDSDMNVHSADLSQGLSSVELPAGLYFVEVNGIQKDDPIYVFKEKVEVEIKP
jgi:hypothetical protein